MLEYDSYLFLENNSTPLYTNPTPENYDLNKPESLIAEVIPQVSVFMAKYFLKIFKDFSPLKSLENLTLCGAILPQIKDHY